MVSLGTAHIEKPNFRGVINIRAKHKDINRVKLRPGLTSEQSSVHCEV